MFKTKGYYSGFDLKEKDNVPHSTYSFEHVTTVASFQPAKHHLTYECLLIYFWKPQTSLVFSRRDIMF